MTINIFKVIPTMYALLVKSKKSGTWGVVGLETPLMACDKKSAQGSLDAFLVMYGEDYSEGKIVAYNVEEGWDGGAA